MSNECMLTSVYVVLISIFFSNFHIIGLYNVSVNLSHPYLREELCEQLQAVSPTTRYKIGVCCKHQMIADSFTVLRTDPGALKINEIYLDGKGMWNLLYYTIEMKRMAVIIFFLCNKKSNPQIRRGEKKLTRVWG